MPVVKIVLKYPEKFLSKSLSFSYHANLASQKRYPVGKKASKRENEIFRKFFYTVGLLSFCLFTITNWTCQKIFGIDWLEENSKK